MRRLRLLLPLCLALAAPFTGGRARADVVSTSDGSRIVGTIVRIHAGEVVVHTAFAGDVAIRQSTVVAITTDHPVAVRLAGGSRYDGCLMADPAGVRIANAAGRVTTPVSGIAASWRASEEDPDVAARRRHWCYETDIDVNGKTGNNNQFGSAAEGRAVLAGPDDKLQLYSGYNRQVTDGQKSSDQFKVGVDYADDMSERTSGYVRDEGGFDRVMGISGSDVFAAGAGYEIFRPGPDTLVVRAGLSYRYDRYDSPSTPSLSTPGADFELENTLKLRASLLTTRIAIVPTFQAFSNYILTHETALEVPLAPSTLHLKVGVSNDYNSRPPEGLQRLDTLYFTRLVLKWGA